MRSFSRGFAALAGIALMTLTACGGGGGGTTPGVPATPTPAPMDGCPTTGALPTASMRGALTGGRITVVKASGVYVPGALAVQYGNSAANEVEPVVGRLDGTHVTDLAYGALGLRTRVISVDPASVDSAMEHLRSLPGVKSVTRVAYRQRMTITANDPYYTGTGVAPYYQTATSHGQWDMHVINLDSAWSLFGTSVTAAPIAVVDTGVDLTHPELEGGKVIRAECFVTYPTSSAQTTGQYVTDTDGHGTDVAGIADAFTNNAFGFAGTAYSAPLLAYRIFPTDPPGGCENSTSTQCDSDTVDEASAINDAVNHGAKVINLSLGGAPPCSTGDPEYLAVENAIKAGVTVVAASGNNGTGYLYCPAADPGVIAVGASALSDAAYPTVSEYVPSYSDYLSSHGTASNGAYLVAPGGDALTNTDPDNLHWIENIYSTSAYDAGGRSSCNGGRDPFNETGNCMIEIVGTSMAVPHVVGVAAMMIAIHAGGLTPAQVAQGLCATAHDIGDAKEGCGRVDAAAAVSWAKSLP